MRGWWTLLILAGCHDPEAESLRARVSAQQAEIEELRKEPPTPEPVDRTELARLRQEAADQEREIGNLDRENNLLRKKVDLYLDLVNQKPAATIGTGAADAPTVVVSGDLCWVLYSRAADLQTKGVEIKRRLTLACYRNAGKQLELVDVREIAPDLEMIQLQTGSRPTVEEVLKALKKK